MNRIFDYFPEIPALETSSFWKRCSRRWMLLVLPSFCFFVGLLTGSLFTFLPDLIQEEALFPLPFSGIPSLSSGFFSCFSTLLINQLIFLTPSFFLGITAFGIFAFPPLAFLKGMTVGLGVSSFFFSDGPSGLWKSALIYAPAAALSVFLFLLFGIRVQSLSNQLRKAFFSSCFDSLSFWEYWKDFLRFLCLAVASSLLGSAFVVLGSVLFP